MGRPCAIDVPYACGLDVDSDVQLLDLILAKARVSQCRAAPVVGLDRGDGYLDAARRAFASDRHGVSLRLRREDFTENMIDSIAETLAAVDVEPECCDLVVDLEADAKDTGAAQGAAILERLVQLPHISAWRNVVVCCTAMPAALPYDLYCPQGYVARSDWLGYVNAVEAPGCARRDLHFSDYGVVHPRAEMVDPRLIGRELSLVYACDEHWAVYSRPIDTANESETIARLCQQRHRASAQCHSAGTLSWGDMQIQKLAYVNPSAEDRWIWPQVETNRHLSVVARQVRQIQ